MLYSVDTERFWTDNEASLGKPFSTDRPQVPMALRTTEGCIWEELGMEPDLRYYEDPEVHIRLNALYNEKAQEIVGRKMLRETFVPPEHQLPRPMRIEEIFGSEIRTIAGSETIGSADWVVESVHSIRQLEERLEYVASLDLSAIVFPEGFQEALERLRTQYGRDPKLGGGIRGPVTAAMSICGVENVVLWLIDAPEVMDRFRDLLAAKIIELCTLLREATDAPMTGFGFSDDNCAMLNPPLYERFGLPILKRVFSVFSPDEEDRRNQHSDSAMGHLMPLLNRVGLGSANFGPTIRPAEIRAAMPRTVIYGQLPPFTFSRGTPQEIAEAVQRDIEEVAADGGLVVTTAGSVNPGSKLEGLRAAMYAIQTHGRYQPLD
jgi:uroporphyrinogen decarboxylase